MFSLKCGGIGACTGALGSLVGLGGGFIAIPLMTGILGISQHQAHGCSLAAVVTTSVTGAYGYALTGMVDFNAAVSITTLGMATAPLGAKIASSLSSKHLSTCLGVFLIASGFSVLLNQQKTSEKTPSIENELNFANLVNQPKINFGIGAVTGFLSGVLGIGGGAFLVPMIHYIVFWVSVEVPS
eukprot:GHVL01031763.1.p1 GENE.GHVL01031763.1~~GHVL01031763.1.p1  ORF type:complete len:184 (+),score=11.47 GHVL01031763.1:276-827(+)